MLRAAVVFVGLCAAALGLPPIHPEVLALTTTCAEVNDDIDQVLQTSNEAIKDGGQDFFTVDGFNQDVHLSAFGIQLPLKFSLQLSDGKVGPFNTLVRLGSMTKCSSSAFSTLDGTMRYNDVSLTYNNMTATFLFMGIQGKLTYRMQPRVSIVISEGTRDCRLQALTLESLGENLDYGIETGTLKGWLVGKLLHRALRNTGVNGILQHAIQQKVEVSVATYFSQAWCNKSSSLPAQ